MFTGSLASAGRWVAGRMFPPLADDVFERERAKLLARTPVPVLWLFGKTQSGKSTLVKLLTGAESARIGSGFRPETRRTFEYDFPSPDEALVKFLDTRGLGELDYDPAEDLRNLSDRSHLMIVTARVVDQALEPVLAPLRTIRRANPTRPVLLALTCLHQAYPGRQHPTPDPFSPDGLEGNVPDDLRRLLAEHRRRFEGLVDRIVPLDVTPPGDGFAAPEFGAERLQETLLDLLPAAYAESLRRLEEVIEPLKDLHEKRAMPFVHGYSTMAASAAAIPVPWVDVPTVAAIQIRLLRKIAEAYGEPLAVDQILSMAGVFGARLVLRQATRELLKAVPFVGSAANSMLAYATTFGIGKAACWYFGKKLAGRAPTSAEFRAVVREQTSLAERIWKRQGAGGKSS